MTLFDVKAMNRVYDEARSNSPFNRDPFHKKNPSNNKSQNQSNDSIYGDKTHNGSFNEMMGLQLQRMHSNINPAYLYGPGLLGSAKGNNIINLAAGEIGNTDGNLYGESRAWCAAFATEMFKRATGHDSPVGSSHYVPDLVDNAKSQGLFASADDPNGAQPGNFVFFGEDYHHVGLVESVDPDGTVHTIEGNTSGQVARRTYSPESGRISGYARVVA